MYIVCRLEKELSKSELLENKLYGIDIAMIIDRKQVPETDPLFEPWTLPDEDSCIGISDYSK